MKRRTHTYGTGGGAHNPEPIRQRKPKHAGPVKPVKEREVSDGCLVGIIIVVISLTALLI